MTDSAPAFVLFGGTGLRGIGGRDLTVSGWGLIIAAPGGGVRDTGASWGTGGCGDDGTYTSVAGGDNGGTTGACSTTSS